MNREGAKNAKKHEEEKENIGPLLSLFAFFAPSRFKWFDRKV
jgi:hypothetical protein